MNRVFPKTVCFATALAIGISSSFCLNFLRSDSDNISPLTVVELARPTAPPAVTESPSEFTIRSIDFANFRYPSRFVGEAGGFRLRDGELLPKRKDEIGRPLDMWLKLVNVTYGDVTGDGADEAIVDLGWITGGTAMPDLVYIFTLSHGKPKLLWAFETGDRADGGFKNVFADSGQLVVELLGKNKIIGRNLYENDGTTTGLCCPTYFTRTRYEWTNNRFRQRASSDIKLEVGGAG